MELLKSSTQYTMRGGPKGVLPESELDEAESVGGIDAILAKHPKAVEIFKQAQKDTEQLVTEATNQLNSQKEKALKALEEQVTTLSEQIKNKLISNQLIS